MMSAIFPPAPERLPSEMLRLLAELARLWAVGPQRPRPDSLVLEHWEKLISAWAADPNLPLLVRKFGDNRGSRLVHQTGRPVVPADNSPAQCAYACAVLRQTPS